MHVTYFAIKHNFIRRSYLIETCLNKLQFVLFKTRNHADKKKPRRTGRGCIISESTFPGTMYGPDSCTAKPKRIVFELKSNLF